MGRYGACTGVEYSPPTGVFPFGHQDGTTGGLDLLSPDQTWPALYASLGPETAIWEMVRGSAARNLAYLANNLLSEIEVDLARVLDLSDPGVVDPTVTELTARDYVIFQELAAATLAAGYEALLVPSAALHGLNLVILPGNLQSRSSLHLVRSVELPLDRISVAPSRDVSVLSSAWSVLPPSCRAKGS